jgi:hypothetical protein
MVVMEQQELFGGVTLTVQVVAVQEEVYFKCNKFKYSSNHSS